MLEALMRMGLPAKIEAHGETWVAFYCVQGALPAVGDQPAQKGIYLACRATDTFPAALSVITVDYQRDPGS